MSVQFGTPGTTTATAVGGQPTVVTNTLPSFPGFGTPQGPGVDPISDYEARASVHAIMANGVGNMANWFRQMLFNPEFGDRKDFLNSPERVQWFKNLAIKDLISGIQKYGVPVFTGDSLKEGIRKTYYQATGVDAFRNIGQSPTQAYYLYPTAESLAALKQVKAPDPTKPEGIAQITKNLGGGLATLIYTLWGHDASVNKRISNQTTPPFLQDGLTNPQSRDFGLIKGIPGGTAYVQGLLANPRPGDQINQDFISVIRNLFKI